MTLSTTPYTRWQRTRPVTAEHSRGSSTATFVNRNKPSIDPTALFNLTYGLFVLTAREDGRDNGCIINTAVQVAENSTRLLISCQSGNLTREMIERTGQFNLSVLSEDVPFETIRHFGMQSGRDTDKFADFADTQRSANGLVYVTGHTNAMFSAQVKHKLELGSHTMFVAEVTESKVLGKAPSCTYAHYHKAIKPKF